MRTKKCVLCLKPNANIVTGYVLEETVKISASFCSTECSENAFKNKYGGFYGYWKEDYGKRT